MERFLTDIQRRSDLLYEHEDTSTDIQDTEKLVQNTLQELVDSPASKHPDLFIKLVHGMRHLTFTSLSNIFLQLGDFSIPGHEAELRKIMLDALPLLKTDSAVALMSNLVKTKSYPAPDSWYSSLAYYKNPTRPMMESILVSQLRGLQ